MLAFDAFAERVTGLLEIDLGRPLNPYDGLYDELALDSFQTLQLIVIIESLADVLVPPLDIPELYTVQDAHSYYESLCRLTVDAR